MTAPQSIALVSDSMPSGPASYILSPLPFAAYQFTRVLLSVSSAVPLNYSVVVISGSTAIIPVPPPSPSYEGFLSGQPGDVTVLDVPASCKSNGGTLLLIELLVWGSGLDTELIHLFLYPTCDIRPTTCGQLSNCSYHGTCYNDTALTKACTCDGPWWTYTDCSEGMYPLKGGVQTTAVCPGAPYQLFVQWGGAHVPATTDVIIIFTSYFAVYDALFMSNSRAALPKTPVARGVLNFTSNDPGSYIATKVDLLRGLYLMQSVPFTVLPWGPPCYANCTDLPCVPGRGTCAQLTGVCACVDSFFGTSCEYGCALNNLGSGYGGEITDGSGPALTAKGLARCGWYIQSSYAKAAGVRVYFPQFDIESGGPLMVQGLGPLDGPAMSLAGATPPPPVTLKSNRFTVNFTTTLYVASRGFIMRWYSLGCAAGSYIDEAAGGAGPYSPACKPCPAGSYTAMADQLFCTPCEPGFVAGAAGATQCQACRPGMFQATPGGVACAECPAGSAVAFTQATGCTACSTGSYTPVSGFSTCLRCNVSGYETETGSVGCTSCPANTQSEVNGADSIGYCACAAGFYHPNASKGVPCFPCPTGARCAGGVARPAAMPGYWMAAGSPFYVLRCVDPGSCPGGAAGSCVTGRTGKLCARCPFGTTVYRSGCRKCSPLLKVALPLGVLFVVLVLTLLYKAANLNENDNLKSTLGLGTALGLWIQYLQFATLFRSFDVRWPAAVTTALSWFSIVNLDLTVLAPACSLPMSYQTAFYLRLCIPLFLVAAIALMHCVHPLHSLFVRSVGPWMVRRLPEMGSLDAMRRLSMGVGVPARVRISARLRYWVLESLTVYSPMRVRSSINACLLLVEVFYIFLVTTAFEPLGCMPNTNGEITLVANPEVLCYGAEWWALMRGAIVGMVVYCLFVPAVNLYAVWRVQSTEGAMSNEHFAAWATFSSIVFKYKRPLRWWMFAILARKLTISVVIAAYPSQPLVQVVGGIVGLVMALIAQFVNRPYRLRQHNKVEAVLLVLNTVLLLCGILFYTDSLSSSSHGFVTFVCFALLAVSTVFMIRVLTVEVIRFFRDSPVDRKSSFTALFNRRHMRYDPAVRLVLKRVGLPSVALFRYLSVADDDDVNSLTRVAVTMSLGLQQARDMTAHGLKVWAARYLPRSVVSLSSLDGGAQPQTATPGSSRPSSIKPATLLSMDIFSDPWLDTTQPGLLMPCSSDDGTHEPPSEGSDGDDSRGGTNPGLAGSVPVASTAGPSSNLVSQRASRSSSLFDVAVRGRDVDGGADGTPTDAHEGSTSGLSSRSSRVVAPRVGGYAGVAGAGVAGGAAPVGVASAPMRNPTIEVLAASGSATGSSSNLFNNNDNYSNGNSSSLGGIQRVPSWLRTVSPIRMPLGGTSSESELCGSGPTDGMVDAAAAVAAASAAAAAAAKAAGATAEPTQGRIASGHYAPSTEPSTSDDVSTSSDLQ